MRRRIFQFSVFATALLAVLSGCSHPSAQGPRPIAIAGARLEPGPGKPVIEYSIVIAEKGKFVAVGTQASVPMPKEAVIVDGLSHTLVPAAESTVIEPGQAANLDMKNASGAVVRSMRQGEWVN
jgi:hypothetical protein